MDNDIKVFNHDHFGNIRTVEVNGHNWFVGNDIARALGYETPKNAIQRHVDSEDKIRAPLFTMWLSELRGAMLINESGLYSLILSSKMPDAKRFKHWVVAEVLPTIHRYGAYITEAKLRVLIDDSRKAHKLLTELDAEKERCKVLETRNAELEYKGEYYDEVLQGDDSLIATTLIAKDYGMSAVRFNSLLNAFKVQYKSQNGVWVLYAKYQDLGYTKTRTFVIPDSATGRTVVIMYWTEAGRDFLYKFLKTKGILPKVKSGSPSDDDAGSGKKYDQLSLY